MEYSAASFRPDLRPPKLRHSVAEFGRVLLEMGSTAALGPLLRWTLWETIAVPELRSQARRVAETAHGVNPELMLYFNGLTFTTVARLFCCLPSSSLDFCWVSSGISFSRA